MKSDKLPLQTSTDLLSTRPAGSRDERAATNGRATTATTLGLRDGADGTSEEECYKEGFSAQDGSSADRRRAGMLRALHHGRGRHEQSKATVVDARAEERLQR